MQNDNNDKGAEKNGVGSHSLTDSPHIGGKKMSSSLKDKLMRFRKYSSPISRPPISACSVKSIQSKMPAQEYSQEDIEKAMNESDPEMKQIACSNTKEIIVIEDDDEVEFNKNVAPENASSIVTENSKEIVALDEYVEIGVELDNPKENGNDTSILKDGCENSDDVSGTELGENDSSFTKRSSFDDGQDRSDYAVKPNSSCSPKKENVYYVDETVVQANKGICPYSKEDIENCVDKESVLKIFNDLKKEYADNQEKLRKLKLVKKHNTKNTPEALQSLNKKWVTCTQLALKKLYDFMPEPRSITFETFLIFLQVDFDAINYNPETDTFA